MIQDSYLDPASLPFHFCPGCGHGAVLEYLNQALVMLKVDPNRVVIVTDIGCSGLSDKYFTTNTFHGLHGRSVTYATGIKLVDPQLKVIVLMGDGGCGIGGHHLLNAARRNIGVTVLVFNNLNYGMTGGEHSATTLPGARTVTTPYGQLEMPMDICGTVSINGASFVARTTSFDKSLPKLIVQAIENDGFSLIDIWELCTAYYVPQNEFSKKKLEEAMETYGFTRGVLRHIPRREYTRAYRDAVSDQVGKAVAVASGIKPKYDHSLISPLRMVVAGAAGKRIGSAATAFCRGAVLSGLWATQRNDYPVTVRAGYSISEVILSPKEIHYTGILKPDLMLVLFPEGLDKTHRQIDSLTADDILYLNGQISTVSTPAQKVVLDFHKSGKKSQYWAIMALAELLRRSQIYPLQAFRQALATQEKFTVENLAAAETMVMVQPKTLLP